MSTDQHQEPAPVKRGDVKQALEVAAALRNTYAGKGKGETPFIVEIGKPWEPGEDGATARYLLQDKSEWRYELHVGCGELCPVLAAVPYDGDSDAPSHQVAEAIAQAGEVILGLTERIAALEGENAALKASAEANADAVSEHAAISALMATDPVLCRYGVLEAFEMFKARADEACGEPAPLRLGRGPTDEEFRRHNATGGGWLLQGVGEDMGGWTMEMRPIPEADIPAMVRFVRDAIPLNACRQSCGVGVTQGQAVADAFKDLAKRQASLGAEASAALTAQDLWDMHDTGEKETP